jgi:integrase
LLLRLTLRRLELAAEIYHIREPQKIPQVMSPDETRRVLAVATSLKARVALSLCHGCGLRAGEVVRLKVKQYRQQKIIRIEQSKGRKDRNVMLSPEMIDLSRQWWRARRGFDAHTTPQVCSDGKFLSTTITAMPLSLMPVRPTTRAPATLSASRLSDVRCWESLASTWTVDGPLEHSQWDRRST